MARGKHTTQQHKINGRASKAGGGEMVPICSIQNCPTRLHCDEHTDTDTEAIAVKY